MKKIIALLAVFCVMLSLVACNMPENTEIKGTTPDVGNPGDPEAYYVSYNGIDVRLNGDMEVVFNALGQPKNYTEEASCAFEGLSKTYTYDGLIIETYPRGEKDYIYAFWLMDDMVQTPEGIKKGDPQSAVEAAYGTECYNGRNAYIRKMKNYMATLIIKDGLVDSIQYTITIG